MAKKKIRVLTPYLAEALGVEAVAGETVSVDAVVADQLLASRAAEAVRTETKAKTKTKKP
jgi:hypothetical protein